MTPRPGYGILPRMAAKPHTVRLRVTDEELEWLKSEAERQERSIASLLRLALRDYVDKRWGERAG